MAASAQTLDSPIGLVFAGQLIENSLIISGRF